MSVTGAQIVAIATADIGRHEEPLGSNTGPFVQKCQSCTFLAGTGWPWCAAAVCYWAKKAGVPLAYNGAGAHDLADHHTSTKQSSTTVMPGDVVDYNIGSGHTGIVVSVDHHASTVTSIDGNWSDAVVRHTMPLSQVRGFWRIPGVSDAVSPPKPKLPPFVVTTSASGHRKIVFRAQKKRTLILWLTTHNLSKLFPNGITVTRGR